MSCRTLSGSWMSGDYSAVAREDDVGAACVEERDRVDAQLVAEEQVELSAALELEVADELFDVELVVGVRFDVLDDEVHLLFDHLHDVGAVHALWSAAATQVDQVVRAFEGDRFLVDVVLVVLQVLLVHALLEERHAFGPVGADGLVAHGEGHDELLQDACRVLRGVSEEADCVSRAYRGLRR